MSTQTNTEIHIEKPKSFNTSTKDREEEKDVLRFAKVIVFCPCLLCVMILVLLCGITYIDSLYFEYTTDANRMYLVESDPFTERADAFVLAQEHVAAAASHDNESVIPQTQNEPFWTYQLMFKLRDESAVNSWLLTPENIETIIEYENKIYLSDAWQNKFCAVSENITEYHFSCASSIQSIARDIAISYDYNYSSMNVADIKQYVFNRVNNPYYAILFNPDINQTKSSHIYRSLFHAALPISNAEDADGNHLSIYSNAEDRYLDQEEIYANWAQKLWNDITVKPNGEYTDGNLEILALSYVVFVEYFIGLLSEAMFFVIFAVLAVLVYMTLHLRSFILALAALLQIVLSFPLAFFFYRLLFQVTHFDTFSSLIIFVLLGVGADDVFVFTDAWYQSVNFVDLNADNLLLQRMSFAYARASKAMFITQVTTFFAFMATATSLIMPISAFGIWAATIVACNYMLVVTLFPCIIILHEKYLKKYEQKICCFICNAFSTKRQDESEEHDGHYRATERFFGGVFTDFILRFRVYILVFFVIVYGLCIYGSLHLKANKGDEVWFEDDHFMQRVSDAANEFTAGETDGLIPVWIIWGVNGVNRRGTNKWDSTDYGVVQWDKAFDFSSVEGQLFIRDACDDLKESHLSFSAETTVCFTDHFEAYLLAKNESYPVIISNDTAEQKLLFAELMYDFLHFSKYGEYVRNAALVYVEHEDNDDYEVKFVSIQLLSDLSYDAAHDVILDEFDLWNEWLSNQKDKCEEDDEDHEYCSLYHTSWMWADFAIKKAFISSAVQGILIAMPLAFVILLISTRNWIISIFAVLDIIGIMLCELGLMAVMDWEFGISEAISVVMIIGFSVDYVVHLANAYLEAKEFDSRKDRLRFALLTMGISVVSGAITTFSAGFFLIFPVITFFSKMGVLMMSTIAFSIVFAMFFFTSLLAQFGPEHDAGEICCCYCNPKQSDDVKNHVNKAHEEIEIN